MHLHKQLLKYLSSLPLQYVFYTKCHIQSCLPFPGGKIDPHDLHRHFHIIVDSVTKKKSILADLSQMYVTCHIHFNKCLILFIVFFIIFLQFPDRIRIKCGQCLCIFIIDQQLVNTHFSVIQNAFFFP